MDKEENIIINDGIGAIELRQLIEFQALNRALNKDEFMKIVAVYREALLRLTKEAKKQGIEI
jgi:hypothetical protein